MGLLFCAHKEDQQLPGYHTIQITRHVFFYGILFMLPALFFMDFRWQFSRFKDPVLLGKYFIFGAVCLCPLFCDLESGGKIVGAVKTSVYLYLVPGGHHCSFSPCPPRKNIGGVCSWDRDGAYGAGPLRQRKDSRKK